ncbi:MAG: isoprenyl transferase [bacterium]
MNQDVHRVPQHIAMIMDGNGRWAKHFGKPRLAGHEAGAETVRRVMEFCRAAGVRYLTLYAFSTENWSRPPEEVAGLMNLLGGFISRYEADLIERNVRLRIIGNRDDLSLELRSALARVEERTKHFEQQVIIALSYSGRNELTRAIRKIAEDVRAEKYEAAAIDESLVSSYLDAPDVPDPDLIVRTSGEFRISNFLLWQCAYSEFYFTPVLWPDFSEADFNAALESYATRDRRYGSVKKESNV